MNKNKPVLKKSKKETKSSLNRVNLSQIQKTTIEMLNQTSMRVNMVGKEKEATDQNTIRLKGDIPILVQTQMVIVLVDLRMGNLRDTIPMATRTSSKETFINHLIQRVKIKFKIRENRMT